jgi:hypothetical protein
MKLQHFRDVFLFKYHGFYIYYCVYPVGLLWGFVKNEPNLDLIEVAGT